MAYERFENNPRRKVFMKCILTYCMANVKDSEAAYDLLRFYRKNVRIKERTLRNEISPYNSYSATKEMVRRIRKNEILFGPRLWINSGFVVEIQKNSRKSSLELFEKYKNDPQVTYLIALMGSYSVLAFKKGASILKSAVCVYPSYPAQKSIPEIELSEKGCFERDEYPNWDELDWKVFHSMRDPTRSFGKVGGELKVSWATVRARFQKILKDCKIWVSFFPKGYRFYSDAVLTFKTEYEIDLKNELEKIDRTSFIYKFNDTIILFLHYETFEDIKTFELLKKKKKIRDLHFSAPIAWHDRF